MFGSSMVYFLPGLEEWCPEPENKIFDNGKLYMYLRNFII